ncbi:MAG: nitroreductase family protein [Planctomycetia bacterium]|nr:nitroreductase family protein [Planctomycetia bacterium]
MDFYQVVNARRTVRDLKEEAVSQEVLERVIAAGLKAPTHNHLREWEFIVLRTPEEKENALQFVKARAKTQSESIMDAFPAGSSQKRMYADAMPKQYSMLFQSGCVILPFFKAGKGLFRGTNVSSFNALTAVWCCIENIFLAATAEGLACSMRIPVGDEGENVAKAVGAPEGYLFPCYIGLGYPREDAVVLEQVEPDVKAVIHFGKW